MHKNSMVGIVLAHLIVFSTACKKSDEVRSDIYDLQRRNMVRWDIKEKGIKDKHLLNAMRQVPRHMFMHPQYRKEAYQDIDIPISQFSSTPRPYIVAKTIELLHLKGNEKVLEVGTGLGYQSALLGELAKEVYTIEIVPRMGRKADALLKLLNYKNVHCRIGDGYKGWEEHQPYDAILVMASAKAVPGPLIDQLKMGGRLVIPIDEPGSKSLTVFRKVKPKRPGDAQRLAKEKIMDVDLKPMEGRAAGQYW